MTDRMQTVQGRCPACGGSSLFLGDGGHVTCARLECPKPEAADEVLRHANLTECEHAAGQRQAEAAIARVRELHRPVESGAPCIPDHGVPTWCPGCSDVCATCRDEDGDRVLAPCITLQALDGDQPPPDVAATQATDGGMPVAEPFFEIGKVYEAKNGARWEIRFQREGVAHFRPVRVDCDSAGLPLAYGKLSLDGDHVWTTMDRFAFGAWKAADRPVTEAADA